MTLKKTFLSPLFWHWGFFIIQIIIKTVVVSIITMEIKKTCNNFIDCFQLCMYICPARNLIHSERGILFIPSSETYFFRICAADRKWHPGLQATGGRRPWYQQDTYHTGLFKPINKCAEWRGNRITAPPWLISTNSI